MNWFETLTGFAERDYSGTKSMLQLDGSCLVSKGNGRRMRIGNLETPSLQELRARSAVVAPPGGPLRVRVESGDVRPMHRRPDLEGAIFQVASQFNLLEMTGPDVSPEDGVTRYESDDTQGPACAIAAGGATLYRNYFVSTGGGQGQTRERQLDMLADLGEALGADLGTEPGELWSMSNGYAMCTAKGLTAIDKHLRSLDSAATSRLKDRLRIGVHWDVEVTDGTPADGRTVSQAFCSALPRAYVGRSIGPWERFARLVLDAAYEATLCVAVLNMGRGASNVVVLTRLGGGAFGNEDLWIDSAIERAVAQFADHGLDVRILTRNGPSQALQSLASRYR